MIGLLNYTPPVTPTPQPASQPRKNFDATKACKRLLAVESRDYSDILLVHSPCFVDQLISSGPLFHLGSTIEWSPWILQLKIEREKGCLPSHYKYVR
jgi:hypothetical protein